LGGGYEKKPINKEDERKEEKRSSDENDLMPIV
jgi:hypothetical protein